MNKAVFTAALIERAHYKQDVSFVGHVDSIEVAVRNSFAYGLSLRSRKHARLTRFFRSSGFQPLRPAPRLQAISKERHDDPRARVGRPVPVHLVQQVAQAARRHQGNF